ncbi:MAG: putative DNA modification/repair radical SAM protein [Anaerolineae bacterium]
MQTVVKPDTQQKMGLLSRMAALDCDGEPATSPGATRLTSQGQLKRDFLKGAVVQVKRADGPMVVLRTLQTSACEQNCYYCPFRAGRNGMPRVSFSPDELAREFDRMQRAGVVSGLFLSSGSVGGGARAMDPMLATVELLRGKYQYRGYIHLKIMPGAERAQVEQAFSLADRVSVNLEGANAGRLAALAPGKDFEGQLLQAMRWVRQMSQAWAMPIGEFRASRTKPPSLVTQFVVGPAGESDRELLATAAQLYQGMGLARAYYSGFNPVPDTPLADAPRTSDLREHRLYQADWLLRFYGFTLDELPFDQAGALPSDVDPKLAWASRHLAERPVEVNRASRRELLRVPGIGPRSADAILRARRLGRLRDLADLRALGALADRAAPFVLLDGKRPARQLSFWS